MRAHLDDLPCAQRELNRLIPAQGRVKHATAFSEPPLQSQAVSAPSPTARKTGGSGVYQARSRTI